MLPWLSAGLSAAKHSQSKSPFDAPKHALWLVTEGRKTLVSVSFPPRPISVGKLRARYRTKNLTVNLSGYNHGEMVEWVQRNRLIREQTFPLFRVPPNA